jgi:hypothetical protein
MKIHTMFIYMKFLVRFFSWFWFPGM